MATPVWLYGTFIIIVKLTSEVVFSEIYPDKYLSLLLGVPQKNVHC